MLAENANVANGEYWILLIKSSLALAFVVALLYIWQWLLKKYGGNLLLNSKGYNGLTMLGHMSLPNKSQLVHIEDQLLKKKYLLSLSSNGKVYLIESQDII